MPQPESADTETLARFAPGSLGFFIYGNKPVLAIVAGSSGLPGQTGLLVGPVDGNPPFTTSARASPHGEPGTWQPGPPSMRNIFDCVDHEDAVATHGAGNTLPATFVPGDSTKAVASGRFGGPFYVPTDLVKAAEASLRDCMQKEDHDGAERMSAVYLRLLNGTLR
jgi:hypothetical protein